MVKIVGYFESKGTFTPKGTSESYQYSNWKFVFITDENPNVKGYATVLEGANTINIKQKDFEQVTGLKTPDELLNKTVITHYGLSYGKPVLKKLEIVK